MLLSLENYKSTSNNQLKIPYAAPDSRAAGHIMTKENSEMKAYTKILVLVAVAMILVLTACSRSASQAPTTASATPQVDFPFETQDPVSAAATQTAIAGEPLPSQPTNTPQLIVATNTPEAVQQPAADTPTEAPAAEQPAAPVNTAAPTLAVERPQTYTLSQGEWPICVARRYDLDLDSFFKLNGMNMNSKPSAGVTVKIPATGNWSAAQYGARTLKTHPVQHTVTAGQTINTIACQYGDVAPESILTANGLASASDVKVGMTINIP
jgi:LysM repeat protein